MIDGYHEEVVFAETEDQIVHAGLAIWPLGQPKPIGVVWTHGVFDTFYLPAIVRIAREMAGAGYASISGNNRGNGFGTMLRFANGGRTLGGAAWEQFDESPRDVAGWIRFTTGLGFARVVLIGHSFGALKVGYYQAERQDPRVAGIVAASPPMRLAVEQEATLARAEEMVRGNQGHDLLPWQSLPIIGTMSARSFVGLAPHFDVFGYRNPDPAIARIQCPLLALYGSNEEDLGTAKELETIRRNARGARRVDTRLIDGADHHYHGRESTVAQTIAAWIDELL